MLASTICPPRGMKPCCCNCWLSASKMALPPRPLWASRWRNVHSVRGVGDVQRAVELAEALEAQPVEHLVFALLVREVVQALQEHHAHQHFGRVRRAATLAAVGSRASRVHCGSHLREVDQRIHRRERLHVAFELGLAMADQEHVVGSFLGEEARGFDARRDHAGMLPHSGLLSGRRGRFLDAPPWGHLRKRANKWRPASGSYLGPHQTRCNKGACRCAVCPSS